MCTCVCMWFYWLHCVRATREDISMRSRFTETVVSPSSSSYLGAEPVAPDAKFLRELKNPFILQLEAPLSLLHRFAFISHVFYYVARTLLSTVLVIHDQLLGLFSRYAFYLQWIAMFLSNTRCFYCDSEKPIRWLMSISTNVD